MPSKFISQALSKRRSVNNSFTRKHGANPTLPARPFDKLEAELKAKKRMNKRT